LYNTNMFRELYKIKYFELDTQNRLKPNVLLDFMSDVATKNADFNNIGYNFIKDKNYAWFLLKYAIKFTKYPENISEIQVGTLSRGANKLFAYREFLISDNQNNTLGTAFSIWGLIDLSTKKMLNLHEVFHDKISDFQKSENDLIFTKIPAPQNISYDKEFKANYYDIDINHHVNNTCLVKWAIETLPAEYIKQHTINDIQIVFKNETKLNDNIISIVEINNNTTFHLLKNSATDEDLAIFSINWN